MSGTESAVDRAEAVVIDLEQKAEAITARQKQISVERQRISFNVYARSNPRQEAAARPECRGGEFSWRGRGDQCRIGRGALAAGGGQARRSGQGGSAAGQGGAQAAC